MNKFVLVITSDYERLRVLSTGERSNRDQHGVYHRSAGLHTFDTRQEAEKEQKSLLVAGFETRIGQIFILND